MEAAHDIFTQKESKVDQVYNFVCKTQDTFLITLVTEICVGIKKRNTLGKQITTLLLILQVLSKFTKQIMKLET